MSAELLGVWSAINTTPTTAGSAMPASGFIKVRNVTGGSFAAGALSGIGGDPGLAAATVILGASVLAQICFWIAVTSGKVRRADLAAEA